MPVAAPTRPDHAPAVRGTCEARFAEVRREFERNLAERGELGAGVCVIHEGRVVVDLAGGAADAARTVPWTSDTMAMVYSTTKAATALCAHMLASVGELRLDTPVRRYWSEFGREGKGEITVRMLLNHQAGLPGVSAPLAPGASCDPEAMAGVLARERPLWRPGTGYGYHAMTFGWLVGELVRRVSGLTVGRFLERYVARPLEADVWIGLPEDERGRVADTLLACPGGNSCTAFERALERREPIQVALWNSLGHELFDQDRCNDPAVRAAEIPAGNGIASARGLARMLAPLSTGGRSGAIELVSEEHLAEMGAVESSAAVDLALLQPLRFSAGFEKTAFGHSGPATVNGIVLSEEAFGHTGMGGSLAFVDPRAKIAFGYAMNRHAPLVGGGNRRCQRLVNATYRALGYRTFKPGRWIP